VPVASQNVPAVTGCIFKTKAICAGRGPRINRRFYPETRSFQRLAPARRAFLDLHDCMAPPDLRHLRRHLRHPSRADGRGLTRPSAALARRLDFVN
jgi:hypothetical protein